MNIGRILFYIGFLFFVSGMASPAIITEERPAHIVFAKKEEKTKKNTLVKYKEKEEISILKEGEDEVGATIKGLEGDPKVEYAERDHKYYASIIPSDKYFDKQWNLKKIGAPKAWDIKRDSPEKVIAVLDSGVQFDHPDLEENIWRNSHEIPNNNIDDDNNGFIDDRKGWNFVKDTPDPSPNFQKEYNEAGILHGTLVTGVAGAIGNNGAGISGVTWNTRIMPLKVLNDKGEGRTSQVIRAVDYAVANGADIINLSFVGINFSRALQDAIERANDQGVAVVAASGNEKSHGIGYDLDSDPMYPVCYGGVMGVGATDTLDEKADFSSYGLDCVDISAPGTSIFSTSVYSPENSVNGGELDEYYDGYWSGTSLATPMVSGALALIKSAHPGLNSEQAKKILKSTSKDINKLNPEYVAQLGSGRLDLRAALEETVEQLHSQDSRILLSPHSDYLSKVKILDKEENLRSEFLAFPRYFQGGVNLAAGDVNGDGFQEVIVGAGEGGGPQVRIFSRYGELKGQFFAYAPYVRRGVKVDTADLDGNGVEEIITGTGDGGGPQIRIFDHKGKVKGQFFAYNKNFRGGVNVAGGDIDGDGKEEIVAGAGKRGGPQVRIFKGSGELVTQFFAFDPNLRSGAHVAVGDINKAPQDSKEEILTAPGRGGGPHLKIFDNYSDLVEQFFAYNKNFRGGINIGVGDIDKDGAEEIITGAGPGGTPHVRMFQADGSPLNSFYGFEKEFGGGVNVDITVF